MRVRKKNNNSLFGVALSDLFISLFFMIWCLFYLMTLQPKTHSVDEGEKLGKLCVELSWDDSRDIDMDLWGKSPTDKVAVGYSHTHGDNLDLYRDVLGFTNNPSHVNMEFMCAKKVSPGEYTFNVSYFSTHGDKKGPVVVTMVIKYAKYGSTEQFYRATFSPIPGQEKTMFNFYIDENLNIDESTINSRDIKLRDAKPPIP